MHGKNQPTAQKRSKEIIKKKHIIQIIMACTFEDSIQLTWRSFGRTKNSKAPGGCEIHSELFKYASASFKERCPKFLNLIMKEEQIPKEFRNAVVIPIYEKRDMSKVKSYRGISLLSKYYKILVKIWAKKKKKVKWSKQNCWSTKMVSEEAGKWFQKRQVVHQCMLYYYE